MIFVELLVVDDYHLEIVIVREAPGASRRNRGGGRLRKMCPLKNLLLSHKYRVELINPKENTAMLCIINF